VERELAVRAVVPDARGPVDQHYALPAVDVRRLRLAGRGHDLDHADAVVLEPQVV
jgi:hypothetical protein